jgi:hypothetical protein
MKTIVLTVPVLSLFPCLKNNPVIPIDAKEVNLFVKESCSIPFEKFKN